ncbi:MAG: response regulator [Candidatus Omnitrophica bacterium]|nr:response regulator [Candidatus Omnitrophota bacterium]MBI5145442.1 response regulator [Candidatus Omnitrophota bacterium]
MAYKLLLVDDDKDVVEALKSRLAREGYIVSIASDGEEALVKVKEADPDVVILDLLMPKMNGFEVLKEIRQRFKDKWRPVIIVSAKTELESVKECYGLEADHYLTKPCSFENLLRGIQTMISLIPLRIKETQ